jgi:hypothetical protein
MMGLVSRLAALFLLAALLPAQENFTGQVVSGSRPVPGAVVTVSQGEFRRSTATDEQGRFLIEGAPAGALQVDLQMFGFDPVHREVTAEERLRPLSLPLTVRSTPADREEGPAAGPRRAPAVNGQNAGSGDALETQITSALDAAPANLPDPAESSQSFLVQGSVSRDLDAAPQGGPFGGMFGPGFGPPPGTGPTNGPTGAPGFGANGPTAGGGPGGGGFGGRGGFGGGPGGGGGRGGGFGGGRGPGGGPGGPGGGRRLEDMTPEQRERVQQAIRQRMANGGRAQVFGNRARRSRETLRGAVFFSLRNSALDASPFAVTGQSLAKPSYTQARFGATIGGALRIPHVIADDRTFFFLNYTSTRSRNPYSSFAVLPTLAERGGDFGALSNTIYDANGTPFLNNRIPASRLNPIAQGLLPLIPLPNLTGTTQNYQLVTSAPQNSDTLNLRVNRSLTAKDRLNFGMSWQQRSGQSVQLFDFRDPTGGDGRNFDVGWSHNFSPRLIHNLRASYNLNRTEATPYFAFGQDISGQLGITGTSRDPVNYGPPNLNFSSFGDLTDSSRLLRRVHTWGLSDSLIIVRGRQTITTGVQFTRLQWNTITEQNARGTLFFGGLGTSLLNAQGQPVAGTGFDFADFLLGAPQQSSIRFLGADTYLRASQYAAFGQDEIRLRPNLTLNLGLRYEYFTPFTEKYGRMANLDINSTFTQVAVVTPGATGPFSGPYTDGLIDPDRNNFSPRVGVAWRPLGQRRLLVRAGYSLFYDGTVYNRIPTRLAAQPPFAETATFTTSLADPLTLADPFTGPASVTVKNTYAVDRHFRVPYAQTWNVTVQHELPYSLVGEIGYLGTKGTRLVMQQLPNRALPGSPLTAEQRRQIGDAVGFTYDSTQGNSIFHALQVRLNRRFRRGVSWNAFYTFSRSIDNASSIGGAGSVVVQNEHDFAAERGLSNFDRRHALTFNTILTSPFGPNGLALRQSTGWAAVLRDWTLTVSATANSGGPATAIVLGSAADPGGTGATGSARADATGLPIYAGTGYFNTLAFAVPQPGTYGNAARNTIPTPGMFGLNVSFGRAFQVGENSRRRLEVRAESNNVLNRVNISGLRTVVNAPDYGLATGAGGMRTMNLTLRYRF